MTLSCASSPTPSPSRTVRVSVSVWLKRNPRRRHPNFSITLYSYLAGRLSVSRRKSYGRIAPGELLQTQDPGRGRLNPAPVQGRRTHQAGRNRDLRAFGQRLLDNRKGGRRPSDPPTREK